MMALKDIRVVTVGPGSQPEETDGAQLDYISLPKDMSTFVAPLIPEPDEVRHLDGARAAMNWLRHALLDARADGPPQLADLSRLEPESRELVNQILGEGEVSIRITGETRADIQESVLAGVWRIFTYDAEGRLTGDFMEVGAVPRLIRWARGDDEVTVESLRPERAPEGVLNGQAILTELAEHCATHQPGDPPHAINLTLLPLSPEDVAFIDATLGRGRIEILSRGYGNCHVISTRVHNLWWVRYTNSVGKDIMNSIEVTDMPAVASAAPEDMADSAQRLIGIIEPYWPEDEPLAATGGGRR
jgi:hydrogenase-1 operon protein HyaF